MIARLRHTARRGALYLRRVLAHRAAVLLYHRVARPPYDPWSLCVSPEHFEEHLSVLSRFARPINLDRFVRELTAGTLRPGSVAVTFDDGYADNLHAALPALHRHGVPATFFIASDAVGNPHEFWWDEAGRYLLEAVPKPETMTVQVGGQEIVLEAGRTAADPAWRAWSPPPGPREAAYFRLWRLLQPLSTAERDAVLDQLAARRGVPRRAREAYRPLSEDELRELAAHPFAHVGAHTCSHPLLAALPPEQQRAEIVGSRRRLEEMIGRPVVSFAYPHGGSRDYTMRTVQIVRDAGFRYACTTELHPITGSTDVYQFPRIYMKDIDGEAFSKLAAAWLGVRVR